MKTRTQKIDGAVVKDATKGILVTITPTDVRLGAKKDSQSCAAANALVRSGFCEEARVHVKRTYIRTKAGKWLRFNTPLALSKEIVAFDRGGSFEPGDYKLTPLAPSQLQGARKARPNDKKKNASNTPAKKRTRHVTTGVRQRFNVGGRIT